jgi:hypothetical protein
MPGTSAADEDVAERSPCESKHCVVRAGQRVGALAARRRTPLTAVGTLLAAAVLVFVLAGRWGQFASAAEGAQWWALTAAAVLQIVSLLSRTEAWNICVRAAGASVDRRRLYRAAGVGYLGNIVNGELGFAARIASLRRAAPRETPKAVVLAATEVPIVLIEVSLAALFSFTLVAPLGLPWWTPLVAFFAILATVAGLARQARRHSSGWWKGLAALGVLPVGPGVGAGAMVLILGSTGEASASAAGVLLTATGTVGALAYGGWALADRLWTKRTTRLRDRAFTTPRRAPTLT